MAKVRQSGKGSKRRVRARAFEAIPYTRATPREERLGRTFDNLVTSATVKDRQIKALQPEIIGAAVRGGSKIAAKGFLDFARVAGFTWPVALYVPRDQQASSRPKPPDNRLYSHDWTAGTGVGTASRDSGGMMAYAAAATTDSFKIEDAGVAITYTPTSRLSYVTYEPDVYCSVAYRMFVDFWPQLIAGQVHVGTSLLVAQWVLSPVLSGSYELLRLNEVTVFDSFAQDAGTTGFANIRHTLTRSYVNSALGTRFLVEGGRTYAFGVGARVWVQHNVTSNYGKQIPQDPTRFRLYAEMTCAVPFMAVTVQQVLVP